MQSGEPWDTLTRIAIDTIYAGSAITTRITMTFVYIDLAIFPRCSGLATTTIATNQILAVSSELAWIRFTFVDLGLAEVACVAGTAFACERVVTIDATATMARARLTVIDVDLTGQTRISWRAFT